MFISQRLEKDPKKSKKGHSKYMQYNFVRQIWSAHVSWSNCVRLRKVRVSGGTPGFVTFITRNKTNSGLKLIFTPILFYSPSVEMHQESKSFKHPFISVCPTPVCPTPSLKNCVCVLLPL